jgi:hypothetical protein
MKRKLDDPRVLGVLALLIVSTIVLAISMLRPDPKPIPPTPTPTIAPSPTITPTPGPERIDFNGLGGPAIFGDPIVMAAIQKEPAVITYQENGQTITRTIYIGQVNYGGDNVSSSAMGRFTPQAGDGTSFVFPGDKYYADAFRAVNADAQKAGNVKIYEEYQAFNSKLMLYMFWGYKSGFEKAGFIFPQAEYTDSGGQVIHTYHMPYQKACRLIWAEVRGETYRDLGIEFDSQYFNNPNWDPANDKVDLNTTQFGTSTV